MKLLDVLQIGSVSGGISVKSGDIHNDHSFDLHGNCNISISGAPSTILWDASNMTMGVQSLVDVTRKLDNQTVFVTYIVKKHADGCDFYPMLIKKVSS